MNTLRTIVCSLLVLLTLAILPACTHQHTSSPQPAQKIADKMAGTHIWHGDHWFDSFDNPISGDTMTIVKISDTVVVFSNNSSLPLTYSTTDSAQGYALFIFKWGPPTLYYFYKGDSMRYVVNNGGIHNEQIELHTP